MHKLFFLGNPFANEWWKQMERWIQRKAALSLSISEVDIHAVLQMVIIELKCLKWLIKMWYLLKNPFIRNKTSPFQICFLTVLMMYNSIFIALFYSVKEAQGGKEGLSSLKKLPLADKIPIKVKLRLIDIWRIRNSKTRIYSNKSKKTIRLFFHPKS